MMDLKEFLEEEKKKVELALDKVLPKPHGKVRRLVEAMRYAVFAGGKRIRPILVVVAHRWCGGNDPNIYRYATPVEVIHNYSLIHDDLPCMDNDDLRRGKPTCHKVFGDAMATLAGDALHAIAFEILAETGNIEAVRLVARNIGANGLCGGQAVDIETEGKKAELDTVNFIHRNKTAALLKTSLLLGALLADATTEEKNSLEEYGENIGLCFQVTDDIEDAMQKSDENKATYPALFGLERSKKIAEELYRKAVASLLPDHDNELLEKIAKFIYTRKL